MLCPSCHAPNPDGAKFCPRCGATLVPAPPSPASFGPAEAGSSPPAMKAKNPRRWPIAAGLLLLFALLLYLGGIVLQMVLFHLVYDLPWAVIFYPLSIVSVAVTVICLILSTVFFFAPTKRIPVLSSLPRLLAAFSAPVFFLLDVAVSKAGIVLSFASVLNLLLFFLLFAAAVLYFVTTLIKPKSAALPSVHLALSILYAFLAFLSLLLPLFTGGGTFVMLIPAFILFLADLLPFAGYSAAAFSLRVKKQ